MQEQLKLTINGISYVTEKVTIGRLVDYYRYRTAISGGSYGLLYREAMKSSDEILKMIECEAFFTAFCPQFIKDLKPGSFRDLSLNHYQEIRTVYVESIKPWLTSFEELLQKE